MMGYQGRLRYPPPVPVALPPFVIARQGWNPSVGVGGAWEGRGGPCAQYISLKRLLKGPLGQRIKYFDKVEKAIIRFKGLGWREVAFLGFILVINLLDLLSIDAQKTGW